MRSVDLAVVGAGPAGAAAAIAALRHDPTLRVVLVDRSPFPRDKACGDGIGPEGVDVLHRLGVRHVLDGYPPLRRVRVRAPDGTEAAGWAPRPGHVVPRSVFDARLRDAALDAGAEPLRRRVRTLDVARDGVVLDGDLHARTLVGADGATSTVRRAVGVGPQPRRHTGVALRGYAVQDPAGEDRELFIGFVADRWPAYVWAFPTGTGVVNVGYGPFDATRAAGRSELAASLRRHLPDIEPDRASLRGHRLPLSTRRPRPAPHSRILLAGDAASLVNPLTGEGIYYALLSGALAGAAAARYDAAPGPAYTAALRSRLGRHLRHTGLAAAMLRHTLPVDLAVAAAARHPRTLAHLCEFALGTGLITPGMARTLTRAAVDHVTAQVASP